MPGLENRERLRGPTARNNCIHCHNIHDAENSEWQSKPDFRWEMLYRYPFPDNLGIHIDPQDGTLIKSVLASSPASLAGLRKGDRVTHVNGQAIISIADIQWVLNGLPNTEATVNITVSRNSATSKKTLLLSPNWRRTDLSWRGSLWSVKPRLRFWAPLANPEELRALGIPANNTAFRVQFINRNTSEGRAAHEAGLNEGDFIVEIEGNGFDLTPPQFHAHLKEHYGTAGKVNLGIARDGKKTKIVLPLLR